MKEQERRRDGSRLRELKRHTRQWPSRQVDDAIHQPQYKIVKDCLKSFLRNRGHKFTNPGDATIALYTMTALSFFLGLIHFCEQQQGHDHRIYYKTGAHI